jgi:hypothetical protein
MEPESRGNVLRLVQESACVKGWVGTDRFQPSISIPIPMAAKGCVNRVSALLSGGTREAAVAVQWQDRGLNLGLA